MTADLVLAIAAVLMIPVALAALLHLMPMPHEIMADQEPESLISTDDTDTQ